MVVVRHYLLMEVKSQDAQAEGLTKRELAKKWAATIRKVLPTVAPVGNRIEI